MLTKAIDPHSEASDPKELEAERRMFGIFREALKKNPSLGGEAYMRSIHKTQHRKVYDQGYEKGSHCGMYEKITVPYEAGTAEHAAYINGFDNAIEDRLS